MIVVEKLTDKQEKVLADAKELIDWARDSKTAEEFYTRYWLRHNSSAQDEDGNYTDWRLLKSLEAKERIEEMYQEHLNNVVLIMVDTRALAKFERMGLIEVIKAGGSWPDKIKILNY